MDKEPASYFSTTQMLGMLVRSTIDSAGGSFGVGHKDDGSWLVSAEFGHEAPDSPMVGGAAYGTGETLRDALRQAGVDVGLWTEEDLGEPTERPLRVLLLEAPEGAEPAEVDPGEAVQGSMQLLADADEAYVFRGDRVVALKHRDRMPEDVHVAIQRRSS